MEKRLDRRRHVLKPATISFGGGGGISCAVRNLSASGALLEVTSPLGFPDQFILHLEPFYPSMPRDLAQGEAGRGQLRAVAVRERHGASRATSKLREPPTSSFSNDPFPSFRLVSYLSCHLIVCSTAFCSRRISLPLPPPEQNARLRPRSAEARSSTARAQQDRGDSQR